MKRVLGALSVAFALGALLAPQAATAQSSGAPPGCSGNSCNPYFATYFPPESWPAMSWLDRYSPSAAPPGNGCMPYLPGAVLGPYASSPNFYCQRAQGVALSRFSPEYHQQVMSSRFDMPAASGASYYMARALVTGDVPPVGTNSMNAAWAGNQLYPASQYSLDCGQTNYLMATYAAGFGTVGRSYSCVMNQAPEADFVAVKSQLEAAGYVWYVSYPFKDTGSGKAVVTYAKYGAACGNVTIPPPPWWSIPQSYPSRAYYNQSTGQGGNYACMQGYVRVKNAGWVDQFKTSPPVCSGTFTYSPSYHCIQTTYDYGDYLGEYFATLDDASKAKAMRIVVPFSSAGGYFNTMNPAGAYLAPIIDPWVAIVEPPPVPLNPPPPPPPSTPADPTNVGGPSTGAGTGTPGSGTPGDLGGAFDWDAYCRTPNGDGTPRTAAWIENCLATPH